MEFEKLVTNPDVLKAVKELGYTESTAIQEKSMPLINEGKDIVGQSYTGSGKTMAFCIPITEKLVKGSGLKALILVPTRELCQQVHTEFMKAAKYKSLNVVQVFGGVDIQPQMRNVSKADAVVGTPGRMLDLIQRRAIRLDQVETLVLDEADKMFEMGFIDDVQKIISFTPNKRQTLLFSATFNKEIKRIMERFMRMPVIVKVQEFVDKSLLEEIYYSVPHYDRFSLLVHLLREEKSTLVLIFAGTRRATDMLTNNLKLQGFEAEALHGGLSQNKRTATLQSFHASKLHVLVATDVAARGLDIKNVTHVYNFDVPKTDKEYLHRVGRTARAGKEGKAVTLLSEKDHDNFRRILQNHSIKVERRQLPEFRALPFNTRVEREEHGYSRGGRQGGGFRRNFRPRGRFGQRR